jgi:hypothetical protein
MDIKTQSSFADGWKILYQARTVFAILLIVALVANLAVFFAARFGGMTKPGNLPVMVCPVVCPVGGPMMATAPADLPETEEAAEPVKEEKTEEAATTAPAAEVAEVKVTVPTTRPVGCVMSVPAGLEKAMRWYNTFSNVMKLTAVIALVSVVFLVACGLLGVMMLVAGQLPGAGSLTSAFFWAIGIVVLMLPWSTLLPHVTCLPIGIPSFSEIQLSLSSRVGTSESWLTTAILVFQTWAKFVVIPVLIILLDLMYLKRTKEADESLKTNQ